MAFNYYVIYLHVITSIFVAEVSMDFSESAII